jgi:transcriptional regulator with XRE-family HTH domain
MNITPEAYGKIERGKTRITEERLSQIASIFGFEPWQLMQLSAEELLLLLIERKTACPRK